MEGICDICGRVDHLRSCSLCGKRVCVRCFIADKGVCVNCGRGRFLK